MRAFFVFFVCVCARARVRAVKRSDQLFHLED